MRAASPRSIILRRIAAVGIVCAVTVPTVASAAVAPGTLLWHKRIAASSTWNGAVVTVSPDGSRIFVTGSVDAELATAAYTASGTRLWSKRYDGDPNACCIEQGHAIAVAPDGETVFVTGRSQSSDLQGNYDQVTIAYDAATGDDLWTRRYDRGSMDGDADTDSQDEWGSGIVVSPDGGTVYTAGEADVVVGNMINTDYSALAYDAASGDLSWQGSYDGGSGYDSGRAIGIAPDGSAVFVTGISSGEGDFDDAATVAFDTSNGDELWAERYDGPGAHHDSGLTLDVSPDGASVFIAGGTGGTGSGTPDWDMFTAGYDTSDGDPLWSKVMAGPSDGYDFGRSVVVSPDGTKVFVLGHSLGGSRTYEITTVAYGLSMGTQRWVARTRGPATNTGLTGGIAATPDGSKVVVASYRTASGEQDFMTISYTAGGVKRWADAYEGGSSDRASSLVLSPNGRKAFVSGGSAGILTVAYRT